MEDYRKRCAELVKKLNESSEVYYNGGEEIIPNYEWDAMFDELAALEAQTGYILPDSPTQKTGFEENNGEKEPHEFPALSLAKTKQVSELVKWAEDKEVWLSWKLDGLTLVLTYDPYPGKRSGGNQYYLFKKLHQRFSAENQIQRSFSGSGGGSDFLFRL